MLEASSTPPGFYEGQERALRALELLDATSGAAIHGDCLRGGVQLAIACDLRVCSADAVLGLPRSTRGCSQAWHRTGCRAWSEQARQPG